LLKQGVQSHGGELQALVQRVAFLCELLEFLFELAIAQLQLGMAQQQALDAVCDLVYLGLRGHEAILGPPRTGWVECCLLVLAAQFMCGSSTGSWRELAA
jgi:hypothetical protein